MKDFNERYAVLSAGLSTMLQNVGWGMQVPDYSLATKRRAAQRRTELRVARPPAVRIRQPHKA